MRYIVNKNLYRNSTSGNKYNGSVKYILKLMQEFKLIKKDNETLNKFVYLEYVFTVTFIYSLYLLFTLFKA